MPTPSPDRVSPEIIGRIGLDQTLDADGRPASTADFERGAIVGRYVVLSRLGQGGMGVVYDAYDPELARKIAIKFLHADAHGRSDVGRRRLLREAQALARLSHPNVVAIYDVGMLVDRVWIAMEFVAGLTLGGWTRSATRGWSEVAEVMTAAGRGLAAAHAAGLVHRDFKPDNVMVGEDGRVRVMDFGLARHGAEPHVHPRGEATDSGDVSSDHDGGAERSVQGQVVGTPAYMSPEQHAGLDADTRSDQFSFCVTMWECLWGQRPFIAYSAAGLAAAVMDGRREPPPRGTSVPQWLRRICERGLAADPAKRFATVDALLEAIARGRARMRRRRVLGIGLALAAIPGGLLVDAELDRRRANAACEQDGDAITLAWPGVNGDVREAARAAIVGIDRSYAETTAQRVSEGLQAYADEWRAVRIDTCRARTDAAADPRIDECLEERRLQVVALTEQLVRADTDTVARAAQAIAGLAAPRPCADARYLALRPSLPEGAAPRVQAVRAVMAEARALLGAGKFEDAETRATEALTQATELGWSPLLADAHLVVAEAARGSREPDLEHDALVLAYEAGGTGGAPELAANAAIRLAHNAIQRDRLDEATVWRSAAEVAVAMLATDDENRTASLATVRGDLALARGDLDEAKAMSEQVLALRVQSFGADGWVSIAARTQFANVLLAQGDHAGAAAAYEEVRDLTIGVVGPDHPSTGEAIGHLGVVRFESGDPQGARALYERALAILERAYGPDHGSVAGVLVNLANSHSVVGDGAKAKPLLERALAINERIHPGDHRETAGIMVNLAIVDLGVQQPRSAKALLVRALAMNERTAGPAHPSLVAVLATLATAEDLLGDLDAAVTALDRAAAIAAAKLPPDHPLQATLQNNLGSMERKRDRDDVAREHYQRAFAIWSRTLEPTHPYFGYAHAGLGDLDVRAKQFDSAISHFEAALTTYERAKFDPGEIADARLGLARALLGKGNDPVRVRALANQARLEFIAANVTKGIAEVDALLAELGP